MTVSIRRMTLGSGYKYLMSSVAQSDGASQHSSALRVSTPNPERHLVDSSAKDSQAWATESALNPVPK